jgi:hypothetical protein
MPVTTFIYALNDPRTGECRYVGKSDRPTHRFGQHLSSKVKTPVCCWIRGLKSAGLKPVLEILDEVPASQWEFWEREYLRVFRLIRVRLLNLEEGGRGGTNSPKSPEHREKIRAANVGRVPSAEHRAKTRLSLLGKNNPQWGKPHTPETKEKIRRAKLKARQ